ncbi:MAG: hypothetical protein LBV04_06225 [Deferribacteraceae bacterium]|jgi:hypothetical protein|nr:hypothetical protein [Deferribacteraceae bacterium]
MKKIILLICACLLVMACSSDGGGGGGGVSTSVEVTNDAASVQAIGSNAKVSLYITDFNYLARDKSNIAAEADAITLISNANAGNDYDGNKIDNDGWYDVTQNLPVMGHFNFNYYTTIDFSITKLKIDDEVYEIGMSRTGGMAWFGYGPYEDNFAGVVIDGSVGSIKNIIKVDPDITDCWNADGSLKDGADPYSYITIECKVNEPM